MIMLIIVMEILAIVANLGLPLSQDVTLRNRATAIARDMEKVRVASIQARASRGSWTPQTQPGVPPAEVLAELPADFTFEQPDCQLVWEHWTVTDPALLGLKQADVAAVTVVATEPRLASLVAGAIGNGEIRFTNGNRTTWVVQ